MGMFDYIKYEANCRRCGEPLKEFQSKSGDSALQEITPAELYKQSPLRAVTFYDYCEHCGWYNEFAVIWPGTVVGLEPARKPRKGSKSATDPERDPKADSQVMSDLDQEIDKLLPTAIVEGDPQMASYLNYSLRGPFKALVLRHTEEVLERVKARATAFPDEILHSVLVRAVPVDRIEAELAALRKEAK